MTMRSPLILIATLSGVLGISTVCRSAPVAPTPPPAPTPTANHAPLTVFISDLHFGLGKLPNGKWNPLEDFRWSNALKGFLKAISNQTGSKTTLVIAGDMFELWQHPQTDCSSGDADHGCTVDEITALMKTIVQAHKEDLEELGRFANEGQNLLVIIPGNHDAGLLDKPIRDQLFAALKAKPGRAIFAEKGVWGSPDGFLVSEHGHQMPNEQVNNWGKRWPKITDELNGKTYFLRPWGEYFVHKLYDPVEVDNSLIDNLIPQSNGVRHLLKKQGTFESAKDIARFLAFNIGEASIKQVGALNIDSSKGPPDWNVEGARALGWALFIRSAPSDAYPSGLDDVNDHAWDDVRSQLDALAKNTDAISDEEVKSLCDKSQSLAGEGAHGVCPRKDAALVIGGLVGALPGAKCRALSSHLSNRRNDFDNIQVFVYGHTHELECPFPVDLKGGRTVVVANTGAFQRLIDDAKFVAAADARHLTPEQGLGALTLEDDAPPCYSAVLVEYKNGSPVPRVQNWLMKETDTAGAFVETSNPACAKLGSCEPGKACK
jgi:hypothetical protein